MSMNPKITGSNFLIDNIEALDKGGEKLLGQKSVKKDYPEMPPILKSSSAIRKGKI